MQCRVRMVIIWVKVSLGSKRSPKQMQSSASSLDAEEVDTGVGIRTYFFFNQSLSPKLRDVQASKQQNSKDNMTSWILTSNLQTVHHFNHWKQKSEKLTRRNSEEIICAHSFNKSSKEKHWVDREKLKNVKVAHKTLNLHINKILKFIYLCGL